MSIRTVTLQDLVEQAFEEEVLNGLAVFFENRLEKRPEAANLLEDDLAGRGDEGPGPAGRRRHADPNGTTKDADDTKEERNIGERKMRTWPEPPAGRKGHCRVQPSHAR